MLSDSGDRSIALPVAEPVILFDGVCNLCNAWVRFVVRHDPAGIFRFAAQQSAIGQAMIEKHFSTSPQLSSVILIMGDIVYTDSTAVLEICARLAPPWSWIAQRYESSRVDRVMFVTGFGSDIAIVRL